jgi:hypothetical protein
MMERRSKVSVHKEGVMQNLTDNCRRIVMGLLGGLLLLAGAGGVAYADHFPAEMVSATKHNLSDNPNIQFGGTISGASEVCVYCHTPHGAGYGTLLNAGMAPLWNRKINTPTTYTTYSSPHFENTSLTTLGGAIKGVSLACLSCHDGSIAFDALINLQGSGGLQAGNLTQGAPGENFVSVALGYSFSGEAVDPADRTFNNGTRGNDLTGSPFGGSVFTNDTLNAATGSEPFPNLGTDLRDDHPISFAMPLGGVALGQDPQFSELQVNSTPDPNNRMLYLRRNAVYPQDKRDRIRAYASDGALLAGSPGAWTNAYIECASCHNPHTPRTLFLRLPSGVDENGAFAAAGNGIKSGAPDEHASAAGITNANYWSHAPNQASAICISCHQK